MALPTLTRQQIARTFGNDPAAVRAVEDLLNRVAVTIPDQLAIIEADIVALETDVAALQADVATLQTEMDAVQVLAASNRVLLWLSM